MVGRLRPTGTAYDRVVFTPLSTFYSIPDHRKELESRAVERLLRELRESPPPPPATAPAATVPFSDAARVWLRGWPLVVLFAVSLPAVTPRIYASDEVQRDRSQAKYWTSSEA